MDIHQFFLGNAFDAYTFLVHMYKKTAAFASAPLPPMQKRYR